MCAGRIITPASSLKYVTVLLTFSVTNNPNNSYDSCDLV